MYEEMGRGTYSGLKLNKVNLRVSQEVVRF